MKTYIFYILLCFLVLPAAGCKVELYSSLKEKDANEMMAVLQNNNIDTDKLPGKEAAWILRVEKKQMASAMGILTKLGYPKESYANMGDIFKKKGMTSTPLEERARFIYALSQEIARTLSEIDGVLSVRAHIVLPKKNPLEDSSVPSSAAVFIKCRENAGIKYNIPKIKKLVAGSIEGLTYDKVSVFPFTTTPVTKDLPKKESKGSKTSDLKPAGRQSLMFWIKTLVLILISAGAGYLIRGINNKNKLRLDLPKEIDDRELSFIDDQEPA